MPEKLESEQVSLEDSVQTGGTQNQAGSEAEEAGEEAGAEGQEAGGEEGGASGGEGGQEQTAQVVASAPRPSVASPYAQAGDAVPVLSAAVRENFGLYFAEDVVAALEADLSKAVVSQAKAESQKYVRAYEQQQEMATELGIPAQYMRDVKQYSDRIPENIRGTKEGAQVAVMYGIHERATSEGGNFLEEMRKFVDDASPKAAAPPPKPVVQALPASARTGGSAVSGRAAVAVGGNGAKTDPLFAHFPHAKDL